MDKPSLSATTGPSRTLFAPRVRPAATVQRQVWPFRVQPKNPGRTQGADSQRTQFVS